MQMPHLFLPTKTWSAMLACGFLLSCGNGPESVPDTTALCVLLDITGVRDAPHDRELYADRFSNALSRLGPGDALRVVLISARSVNEAADLMAYRFPPFAPTTDNAMLLENERGRFNKRIAEQRDSLIALGRNYILHDQRVDQQTHLIGALHRAADALKQMGNPVRKLVVLSDMEEVSDHYNFMHGTLTDERIGKIIEAEKRGPAGLPRLDGVQVLVIGARSSTEEQFFRIRNFWKRFFNDCGALLGEADYRAS